MRASALNETILRIPQFFQRTGKFERPSLQGFVRKLQRRLGAFLLGNFLSRDIDAKNSAIFSLQRMPVCNPHALCVTPVRALAIDLYARDSSANPERERAELPKATTNGFLKFSGSALLRSKKSSGA